MYGMGVAVADYDNDGRDDVYITALDGDRLFHNEGGGRFRDVTKRVRHRATPRSARAPRGSTTTATARLDLFVANYVQWTPKSDLWCSLDGATKSYCTPESYKGTSSKLYRNLGGGRFEDVTEKAGLADPTSKSLGVAVLDYNDDGWPDLFVANDTQPNKLYRNNAQRHVRRGGPARPVWRSAKTAWRAARWASTRPTTTAPAARTCSSATSRTRCSGSITTKATGCSSTRRRAPRSAAPACSRSPSACSSSTTTSTASSTSSPPTATSKRRSAACSRRIQFQQPPLLFRNLGKGRFEKSRERWGRTSCARWSRAAPPTPTSTATATSTSWSARITARRYLFRNDGGNRNHWLALKLDGHAVEPRGHRARVVRVQSASGKQWQMVHSGSSYCSQSDLALTFGLGRDAQASAIEIEWPSGATERLANVAANQRLIVREGKGIVAQGAR